MALKGKAHEPGRQAGSRWHSQTNVRPIQRHYVVCVGGEGGRLKKVGERRRGGWGWWCRRGVRHAAATPAENAQVVR